MVRILFTQVFLNAASIAFSKFLGTKKNTVVPRSFRADIKRNMLPKRNLVEEAGICLKAVFSASLRSINITHVLNSNLECPLLPRLDSVAGCRQMKYWSNKMPHYHRACRTAFAKLYITLQIGQKQSNIRQIVKTATKLFPVVFIACKKIGSNVSL